MTAKLDDFGAGFGSFYYHKHLIFDYVKIDSEFVQNAPSNPVDQLIIASVVDIARGMGTKTVAEFVASQDILECMREYGVDYAQGFHISRPEPVDQLVQRLRARQTTLDQH